MPSAELGNVKENFSKREGSLANSFLRTKDLPTSLWCCWRVLQDGRASATMVAV